MPRDLIKVDGVVSHKTSPSNSKDRYYSVYDMREVGYISVTIMTQQYTPIILAFRKQKQMDCGGMMSSRSSSLMKQGSASKMGSWCLGYG